MSTPLIQSKVKALRWLRVLHKWMGVPLIIFFFIIGITSILLAWKKKADLLPPTQKSEFLDQGEWISPAMMISIAELEMERLGESKEVDRIDIRPDKGIAKVTFKNHFKEVQVDGFSGEILSVDIRHSDWIEKVHDGSIIDFYTSGDEGAKLTYSTLASLGLILLAISGFYLWYYPKLIRRLKS
jgi:uncharacterized iron-regulated membrane protein